MVHPHDTRPHQTPERATSHVAGQIGEQLVGEAHVTTGEALDPRIAEMLKPEKTAIIVVDMIEGYRNPDNPLPTYLKSVGAPYRTRDLDAAADRMVDFLDASRQSPLAATVFMRFPEGPSTAPANVRRKMEIEGSPDVATVNGVGWDYYKVRPQAGDVELTKYDYDAFHETGLDTILTDRRVETVIIIGAYASVCVDETASGARRNGYNIFVPADLTADIDSPQEPQTPDMVRAKLNKINDVTGYMPLSSAIVETWQQLAADTEK